MPKKPAIRRFIIVIDSWSILRCIQWIFLGRVFFYLRSSILSSHESRLDKDESAIEHVEGAWERHQNDIASIKTDSEGAWPGILRPQTPTPSHRHNRIGGPFASLGDPKGRGSTSTSYASICWPYGFDSTVFGTFFLIKQLFFPLITIFELWLVNSSFFFIMYIYIIIELIM